MSSFSRLKLQMARCLCHPFVGRVARLHVPHYVRPHGISVPVAAACLADSIIASMLWGLYEKAEALAVQHGLARGLPVVELGASIGVLSCLIARECAPAHQLAVEANPLLIDTLIDTLELNARQSVRVVPAMIHYGDAEHAVLQIGDSNVAARAALVDADADSDCFVRVRGVTLSDLLSSPEWTTECCGCPFTLVMDIEGAEVDVFQCEASLLAGSCYQILAELHPDPARRALPSVSAIRSHVQRELGFIEVWRRGNVSVFQNEAITR